MTTSTLIVYHCTDAGWTNPTAPKEAPTGQADRGGKDAQIDETAGVTEESVSPWSSPVVLVWKRWGLLFLHGLHEIEGRH
jgi:hypothetical protein